MNIPCDSNLGLYLNLEILQHEIKRQTVENLATVGTLTVESSSFRPRIFSFINKNHFFCLSSVSELANARIFESDWQVPPILLDVQIQM